MTAEQQQILGKQERAFHMIFRAFADTMSQLEKLQHTSRRWQPWQAPEHMLSIKSVTDTMGLRADCVLWPRYSALSSKPCDFACAMHDEKRQQFAVSKASPASHVFVDGCTETLK